MILDLVKYPDKRLSKKSDPVSSFDKELHQMLDNMIETMYHAKGIGLAGCQVGFMKRVFVMDLQSPEDCMGDEIYEIINPIIIRKSKKKIPYKEGCLSFPEEACETERFASVTIKFQDRYGISHVKKAQDLAAICIQHEIDHLDGITMRDRI